LPSLKNDLIDDFRNKKYAIILDESTDISIQKHLCMLVRTVSDKRKEIVTGFIGLIPVQEATGEKIFNLIDEEKKDAARVLQIALGLQRMVHQTWLGATTLCGVD
jgi:hypothetical protein